MTQHDSPPSTLLMETPVEAWTVAAPLAIPKPVLRTMATFGHLAERFLVARQVFLKRVAKPGQFDEMKLWLAGLLEQEAELLKDEGCFASLFDWQEHRLLNHTLVLDQETTEKALELWHRVVGGENEAPAAMETLANANAAIWPALLRLRLLREFWDRELGRSHRETLCALLPDAWVLSPEALPPGAVIPRLELAGWEEFAHRAPEDRTYLLSSALQSAVAGSVATQDRINSALSEAGQQLSVLTEGAALKPGTPVIGIYQRKGKRTEVLATLALRAPLSVHPVEAA